MTEADRATYAVIRIVIRVADSLDPPAGTPSVLGDQDAVAEPKEKVDYATGDLAVVEAAWHERVDSM